MWCIWDEGKNRRLFAALTVVLALTACRNFIIGEVGDESPVEYTITVAPSISGGSITVHNNASQAITTAYYGDSIYITAAPEAGKILASVTVTGGAVSVYGTGNSRHFTMPAANVTVNAVFATPVTVTGKINLRTEGLADIDSAYLALFSSSSGWSNPESLSGSSSFTSDGDYNVYTLSYSFELPPASVSTAYYAKLTVNLINSKSESREIGLLFTLTPEDTGSKDAGVKDFDIGFAEIYGTLGAVTLNGQTPDYVTLHIYPDANYSAEIGSHGFYPEEVNNWEFTIPDNLANVYFKVDASCQSVSGYKKLGPRTVSPDSIDLGAVAISTKTVSGTLKNGGAVVTSDNFIQAIGQKFDTVDAMSTARPEEYGSDTAMNGAWSMTVSSDLTEAYLYVFLIGTVTPSTLSCYRSANPVPFNASGDTTVNLDLANMTFLGDFDMSWFNSSQGVRWSGSGLLLQLIKLETFR
jgi:hypothetical protein